MKKVTDIDIQSKEDITQKLIALDNEQGNMKSKAKFTTDIQTIQGGRKHL